jgi:hypothetical protein
MEDAAVQVGMSEALTVPFAAFVALRRRLRETEEQLDKATTINSTLAETEQALRANVHRMLEEMVTMHVPLATIEAWRELLEPAKAACTCGQGFLRRDQEEEGSGAAVRTASTLSVGALEADASSSTGMAVQTASTLSVGAQEASASASSGAAVDPRSALSVAALEAGTSASCRASVETASSPSEQALEASASASSGAVAPSVVALETGNSASSGAVVETASALHQNLPAYTFGIDEEVSALVIDNGSATVKVRRPRVVTPLRVERASSL